MPLEKKLSWSREKFLSDVKFLSTFYNKPRRKAVTNKLRQKFGSFMQSKCSYIIYLTSFNYLINLKKQNWLQKFLSHLSGWLACLYEKWSSH